MTDSGDRTDPAARHVDPGALASRSLWRRLRRGVVALLIALGAVVGLIVLTVVAVSRSDSLLVNGSQTPGVVESANWVAISVRYTAAGVERVGGISLNGLRSYQVGERVTVVYDPADPERIRTTDEENDPVWMPYVFFVLMVIVVVAVPVGVIITVRWWGRHRSVREHGWRIGTAVAMDRRRRGTVLGIEFSDWRGPPTLHVRTTRPTELPYPGDPANGDVVVGGAGGSMVVMFRTGSVLLRAKQFYGFSAPTTHMEKNWEPPP